MRTLTLNKKLLVLVTVSALSVPFLGNVSFASSASDAAITAKVKADLIANKVTNATNISVTTNDNKVILSGVAQSATAASTAVQIAASESGVKNVDASNLKVADSSQPMTDTYITAKVKGIYTKNNLSSGNTQVPLTSISVETNNGVVYLSGDADNKAQVSQAVSLAKSVDGVKKVVSDVNVA